ncbi:MAG: AAA family ATPase [Gammaproteobacteria bacterium]|nr:AAA family ATPase [Gammaproteobacteria bacterium]
MSKVQITLQGALVENTARVKRVSPVSVADAVVFSVSGERPDTTPEEKSRQALRLLKQIRDAGKNCVIVADEAHLLHPQVLKAMKRFRDKKNGLRPLTGIILVGQPELQERLEGGFNDDIREVSLRCEIANIQPLKKDDIQRCLAKKFKLAGVPLARVFENSAFPALADKFQIHSNKVTLNTAYPQDVDNFVAKLLNSAEASSYERVDASLVKGTKQA